MRLKLTARLILLSCLGYAPLAFAALGGDLESVNSDQAAFQAARHSTSLFNIRMHELTTTGGTVVREYSDLAGHVFAVTWRGPIKPDLKQLLGASVDRLTAAQAQPHPGHGALAVHDADLVIESTGRMRAFVGRAYLPQAVPAGVAIDSLQ